jgi:hypothetical protein
LIQHSPEEPHGEINKPDDELPLSEITEVKMLHMVRNIWLQITVHVY